MHAVVPLALDAQTSVQVLSAVTVLAAAIYATWRAGRNSDKATTVDASLGQQNSDREDFKAITDNLWLTIGAQTTQIADLMKRTTELTDRLDVEVASRRTAEERAEAAEERAEEAAQKTETLRRRVDQLEAALRDANVPIPPTV